MLGSDHCLLSDLLAMFNMQFHGLQLAADWLPHCIVSGIMSLGCRLLGLLGCISHGPITAWLICCSTLGSKAAMVQYTKLRLLTYVVWLLTSGLYECRFENR